MESAIRCPGGARRALPLSLLVVVACSGQPVSVTVQAGGTVVVPLTVESTVDGPVTLGSYGFAHSRIDGTRYEDPQRGELLLRLVDGDADPSNDVEFRTRGVFVAEAPVETGARSLQIAIGRRLLLVADVPDTAPLGTHALALVHRRVVDGQIQETQPLQEALTGAPVEYFGEIKILPHTIDITLPDSTVETAVGTPTPDVFYFGNASDYPFGHAGLLPELAMPATAFSVRVLYDPQGAGAGQYPGYVKLSVTYPDDVIDIQGVVLAEAGEGRAWYRDDGAGLLTIEGVSLHDATVDEGVGPFQVLFSLDDAQTSLLDAADLGVQVVAVADAVGQPVDPVAWGIVVPQPEVH